MQALKWAFFVLLWIPSLGLSAADEVKKIRVAQYDDKGCGDEEKMFLPKIFAQDPSIEHVYVTGEQVRNGILDKFDVFILPGGSGSGQGRSLGPDGVAKVKEFVRSGKGLFGICAGCYFPLQQDFCNATCADAWERGVATLKIELSDKGKEIFGKEFTGELDIIYMNGPTLTLNVLPDLPKCEPLAWFRSEVSQNGVPEGEQINTPAIILTTYGKGKILTSSPHPERTPKLQSFVLKAVHYLAE